MKTIILTSAKATAPDAQKLVRLSAQADRVYNLKSTADLLDHLPIQEGGPAHKAAVQDLRGKGYHTCTMHGVPLLFILN